MLGWLVSGLAATAWDVVPPANLSELSHRDFTDAELDIPLGGNESQHSFPFLLGHFKELADAVVEQGDHRGFINLSVWRSAKDNKPHNARIMENHLALAFFYTTDRPWNATYYRNGAVRQRLEAALNFWLGIQNPDGRFSEYSPRDWNLAATAFATKFMGETLRLLARPGAPGIDPLLLQRMIAADKRAINFVLTNAVFYSSGKRLSNQYGNIWAGGLAFLELYPDPDLLARLIAKCEASRADFQSSAGFFYENDGPDWSYNLGTHGNNQRLARHYTRPAATPQLAALKQQFAEQEQRFYEWLSYNAVPVPDWSGFVLNRGIETRKRKGFTPLIENSYGDDVPLTRAFAPGQNEIAARKAANRRAAASTWPALDPLQAGSSGAYTPYEFLSRDCYQWHPTEAQRNAARQLLPYLARTSFNHQRVDDRLKPNPVYTFVRRPAYYTAFNAGDVKSSQQRLGLGLLWHPKMGALLQSQSASQDHAWGTLPGAARNVSEAADLVAAYRVGGKAIWPAAGARDLADGDLTISYQPGPGATKELQFHDDRIDVTVVQPGNFREQLPLLMLPTDVLTVTNGLIKLARDRTTLRITLAGARNIDQPLAGETIGPYRVNTLHVQAAERLSYSLQTLGSAQ